MPEVQKGWNQCYKLYHDVFIVIPIFDMFIPEEAFHFKMLASVLTLYV